MSQFTTSVNPADNSIIAQYAYHNSQEIETSIQQAASAQKSWSALSFAQRATTLSYIATSLRAQKEKLALLATREMGKPLQQSMEEVEKCAQTLLYYAQNGEQMLQSVTVPTDASESFITYKPLGVILAIMPWNFPFWQVFRAFAPISMAGNVLLLKHASNVSGCAKAIEDIILASGAPIGLMQTLLLPPTDLEQIIGHKLVAGVTLTGSTYAGRNVAQLAGKYLKKCVLELGGSDAYVMLNDVNIHEAAHICVQGRLKNSGQSCVAAKRFIVTPKNKEAFEQEMTSLMKQQPFGDPLHPINIVGPMARKDLRDELHQQVLQSIAMGATLLCGGYIPTMEGYFYPPTVLTNVTKGMPAFEEELFGPVAAIIAAKDERDAIAIANDSDYGLGAAVIGNDAQLAKNIATNLLEAGNCFVNAFVHSDARLPFGGIKNSGYGRELSDFGIKEFVNVKTVFIK